MQINRWRFWPHNCQNELGTKQDNHLQEGHVPTLMFGIARGCMYWGEQNPNYSGIQMVCLQLSSQSTHRRIRHLKPQFAAKPLISCSSAITLASAASIGILAVNCYYYNPATREELHRLNTPCCILSLDGLHWRIYLGTTKHLASVCLWLIFLYSGLMKKYWVYYGIKKSITSSGHLQKFILNTKSNS